MRILITLLVSLVCISVQGQKEQETPFPKFGKITASDLQKKSYAIDSNARAIVLQDVGNVSVEGNSRGWFSLVTKRHKIVHILNKNGYSKATIEIPLYSSDGIDEDIKSIKAVTYNLENGKVQETKFDKANIFTVKESKTRVVKKFTLPNVKEGSIIEFEYTVNSEFLWAMDPWHFQENVPVLWSELNFSVPGFYLYAPQLRGYLPLTFQDRKERSGYFNVVEENPNTRSRIHTFSANVSDVRWVIKDVPALEEESFTSSIKNHMSRMEFTLIGQGDPLRTVNFHKNWDEITKDLMNSESFGKNLNSDNWIADDVKPMFASSGNDLEKAKKIFYYVRDNFTCNGNNGVSLSESFKDIIKKRKGSVADLNLVLAGLLKKSGLQASPLILSTSSNGYVYDTYPTVRSFNYVVVLLKINGKSYFLDASKPLLGFNYLLPNCYNGSARIIDNNFAELTLNSDSLKENSTTMVIFSNDEKGNWLGKVSKQMGMFESYTVRDKVKTAGMEQYFKDIEKEYGQEIKIDNPALDSLKNYDVPVIMSYLIDHVNDSEEVLYINPLLNEGLKTNPFTASSRSYPIEMPFAMDETYLMTMEVPAGYVVDEMPKQTMVKLDESGASFFEYRITLSGNLISFRSRVKLNKAFFLADDYPLLRAFFGMIVKKHAEQIVFKKQK